MEYFLGALAVFWIWNFVSPWVTAPEWAWHLFVTALSLGCGFLVSDSRWYWGFGIAGMVLLIRRTADLLLLLADHAMFTVLRNTRR